MSLIGKILFGALFFGSGIGHLKNRAHMVRYAEFKKLPLPMFSIIASGVFLLVAPVLYIAGVAEVAVLMSLALFLVIASLIFHAFWKETDPTNRQNEMISFNKNIALIGAILVIITLL